MISPSAAKEFQDLYKTKLGIDLSIEEANRLGNDWVKLVKTAYGQNMPKQWRLKIDRKVSKN